MLRYPSLLLMFATTLILGACNHASNKQSGTSDLSQGDSIARTDNNPASRDLQTTALPDSAISENLNIQETGSEFRMVILNEVLFEGNTAKIQEEEKFILEQAATLLNTRGDGKVMITGNSSMAGEPEEALSRERAKAVFDFLKEQPLKADLNLQYQGVGNRYLMYPNDNEDGTPNEKNRRINQRIEIVSRRASR